MNEQMKYGTGRVDKINFYGYHDPTAYEAMTSGFLQILPRGRNPCLRLTLPATERVVDFHRQVIAHAGHT